MKVTVLIFIVISTLLIANAVASDGDSFGLEDCSKDTELGDYSCEALFWRYKWSEKDRDCIKAVYGGCRATKNNFETKEECLKVAEPVCKH
ncbi:hypothetical protein JTB14_037305 [Gonioctena quinquepunctata]|nr:hypothetical protein JTB14_037305 [Gonioctena quinquepunctata]